MLKEKNIKFWKEIWDSREENEVILHCVMCTLQTRVYITVATSWLMDEPNITSALLTVSILRLARLLCSIVKYFSAIFLPHDRCKHHDFSTSVREKRKNPLKHPNLTYGPLYPHPHIQCPRKSVSVISLVWSMKFYDCLQTCNIKQ